MKVRGFARRRKNGKRAVKSVPCLLSAFFISCFFLLLLLLFSFSSFSSSGCETVSQFFSFANVWDFPQHKWKLGSIWIDCSWRTIERSKFETFRIGELLRSCKLYIYRYFDSFRIAVERPKIQIL